MASAKRKPGTGLSILLAVAMVVLFFVASIAVSFVFAVLLADDQQQHAIGINYGRVADNLPAPARVVQFIKSLNIRSVKIYDANPDVLKAFQGTNLRLSIMVTNQEIERMADASSNFSDQWVQQNILAYPSTNIETAIVGNEVLSDQSLKSTIWSKLVPAMENLHSSLQKLGFGSKIKVTTSLAIDCLKVSYPPSEGVFREDISEAIMQPMLRFLEVTGSFFFINVYPYFAWLTEQQTISLDYALFRGAGNNTVQDASGLHYENLLDAQLDALVVAMTKLGYGGVKLSISETGWPSKGSVGASVSNAAEYNRRLVLRILGKSSRDKNRGTPRRPGRLINTFIFALFNEDQKSGAATERNWGLLYPNGSKVYEIDVTGKTAADKYPALNLASAAVDSTTSSNYSAAASSYYSTPTTQNMPELPKALNPNSTSATNTSSNSSSSINPSSSSSNSSSSSSSSSTADDQMKQDWCVATSLSSLSSREVQGAIDYACGTGKANCTAIQPGEACYLPNDMQLHASYAFNSYWQNMKSRGGSCSFNGAAKLTNVDPSYGSCIYPVL